MKQDSTTRFSSRVEDYVKYRPHYPAEVIAFLQETYGLADGHVIADIGSGTGISAELFLKKGYTVIGVEPNQPMREKSIQLLQGYPRFTALDGTAENIPLADQAVDAILSGQAFHWFDRRKAKSEFKRILKANGFVVLIWNERQEDDDFGKAFERLVIDHAQDYQRVDHRNISEKEIGDFYSPKAYQLKAFPNAQQLDYNGLEGRLLSSSYMPQKNSEGYSAMVSALRELFDKYEVAGQVTIAYLTKVYVGQM
ncbi:class I SAM-dependent methyltransferase [Parapedobacter koreensis]|uniref:Methyltransferase domain-containing protein n=1 Tax=Parapedobacter koreensis TaxID=332977 RepID=A0A1H7SMD5_9SPHI|nr:class I SAM-dependent methyltransferase [Parapedobacter koreensis]SEL73810.1 Methyltransferase domain-containing protein [Parapedobacter koreensis]